MGQKINPIAFRLGVNRGWDSIWFAKKKEFGKYLIEDFKIRKYIQKNILNSGVSDVIIERSGKKLIVSIHTSRPGFVIGKKGADIEKIKSNVLKISKDSEITINIKEIKKPFSRITIVLGEKKENKKEIKKAITKEAIKKTTKEITKEATKEVKK